MAYHLLSTNLLFFISPNFLDLKSQNLKLTHVDKKTQNEMFSGYFSIHKRKDLSKNFNEHYILTKKNLKQQ